jgi:hypothetical protein
LGEHGRVNDNHIEESFFCSHTSQHIEGNHGYRLKSDRFQIVMLHIKDSGLVGFPADKHAENILSSTLRSIDI